MELELDQAKAVLAEAVRGGFMTDPMPETDEEILKQADYWYSEAQSAYDAGMRHETVAAIVSLVTGNTVVFKPETNEVPTDSLPDPDVNPGYSSGVPPRSSGGYSESDLRDVPGIQKLPVPKDFEDDVVEFPMNIDDLTDREVRRLNGQYNAYLSRAKWLLSQELNNLANSTHLRDHAYRVALKSVVKVDPKTEKTKLKEVIDSEVREDAEFSRLDGLVLEHQLQVTQFKALVDIYSGNIDRLSREWTMRQDEYEKTR